MPHHNILLDVIVLLAAAVIMLPISIRFGLGPVLGYLLAGIFIGPSVLQFITNPAELSHVSELGVVFLLFVIGLELEPRKLYALRVPIFAMGGMQLTLVTGVITALGVAFGFDWRLAMTVGLGFAMSSTAIAVQLLKDRNLFNTQAGSSAFSVLLFQDISVIPVLALLPILAGAQAAGDDKPSAWIAVLVVLAVILVGHFALRHVFRFIALMRIRELFTSLSLLIVIGLAATMQQLGISMALGAFVGGVLLANSEYRHAIESDIEPFKGLLLGLFFMTIGMSIDFSQLGAHLGKITLLLLIVLSVKFMVHYSLARIFKLAVPERSLFSILIVQVGEFAFVIFAIAQTLKVMDASQSAIVTSVVALSMAATPIAMRVYDRMIEPLFAKSSSRADDKIEDEDPQVIIAGFGRFGQIVGRLLFAQRIRATVLDHDPDQVELVRKFGFKVYYGDATRIDLLESAGIAKAKILVVAIDSPADCLQLIDAVKDRFPQLQIVSRARNVGQVYELMDRDITLWERETFEGSLRLGADVLQLLGWAPYRAVRSIHQFRRHNLNLLKDLYSKRKNERLMLSSAQAARESLAQMFDGERERLRQTEAGWHEEASQREQS